MKNLEEMTRKELAEMIVKNQIERGIIEKESFTFQLKMRLVGSTKMSKQDLLKICKGLN